VTPEGPPSHHAEVVAEGDASAVAEEEAPNRSLLSRQRCRQVELPDLASAAQGHFPPGHLHCDASVQQGGTGWLTQYAGSEGLPIVRT
jgi:hypothetical protein